MASDLTHPRRTTAHLRRTTGWVPVEHGTSCSAYRCPGVSFDRFAPSKGVAVLHQTDPASAISATGCRCAGPAGGGAAVPDRPGVASTDDDALLTRGNSLTVMLQPLTDAARVAVDEALVRMEDGSYGNCVDRAEALPVERLDARPTAARCAPCQSRGRSTGESQRQPLSTEGGSAGSNHDGRSRARSRARRSRRQPTTRTRPNGHRKHDPGRNRPVEPRDPMC